MDIITNREDLRSAIIGMVLGDGCISKRHKNGNAYYQMSHSEKQFDYMLWKQKILNNITSSKIHENNKVLNGKEYKIYHLSTKRHPFFTKLYNRFYCNKIKVVDEYLVKKINDLALAIWFMDDGCRGKDYSRKDSEKPSYYLHTNNFDYANQLLLKKSLKINHRLDWNLNKTAKDKDGCYRYKLRLARRYNDIFESIIKPYIIPCMLYKVKNPNASQDNFCDIVRTS